MVFSKEHKVMVKSLYELKDCLNLDDYRIWGLMQEHMYKTAICDTTDSKQCHIDTQASILQNIIDEAVYKWRKQRLCACKKAKEHLLKYIF